MVTGEMNRPHPLLELLHEMLDPADRMLKLLVQRPALHVLEQQSGRGVLHEVMLLARQGREVGRLSRCRGRGERRAEERDRERDGGWS